MKIDTLFKRRKRAPLTPEQVQRLIGRLRIGELNKLFGLRYGGGRYEYVLPDDDAGREDLEILIQHYGHTNPHKMMKIIKLRAPWMDFDESCRVIERVNTYPRKWRAEAIGRLERVTKAEWEILDLRTIAPIDLTRDERRQERKFRNRLRMRLRRRTVQGRKPRDEWLAANSKSRNKPWEAAGISRAKWYRQRAKAGETGVDTGVCPIKKGAKAKAKAGETGVCSIMLSNAAHTPVSPQQAESPTEVGRACQSQPAPHAPEAQTPETSQPPEADSWCDKPGQRRRKPNPR